MNIELTLKDSQRKVLFVFWIIVKWCNQYYGKEDHLVKFLNVSLK